MVVERIVKVKIKIKIEIKIKRRRRRSRSQKREQPESLCKHCPAFFTNGTADDQP